MTTAGGTSAPISIAAGLILDAAPATGGSVAAPLTQAELSPLVTEAYARWAAAGFDLQGVGTVEFRVVDLPGSYLGLSEPGLILIDQDAAGHGWLVDSSPASDEEFRRPGAGPERTATGSSPALGRVDLLTVIEHELGHSFGLDHTGRPGDVMDEELPLGTRRVPSPGQLGTENTGDQAMPGLPADAEPVMGSRFDVFARDHRPSLNPSHELVDHVLSDWDASGAILGRGLRSPLAVSHPQLIKVLHAPAILGGDVTGTISQSPQPDIDSLDALLSASEQLGTLTGGDLTRTSDLGLSEQSAGFTRRRQGVRKNG